MAAARMYKNDAALFGQLLRRSGNDTGEIEPGKYSSIVARVFAQAKLKRTAGYDSLAHLVRHGWFTRYANDPRKISGLLSVGRDCDCEPDRRCVLGGCDKSLFGLRADAKYCSDAHSKAARRGRSVTTVRGTRTAKPVQIARSSSPDSPDTVRDLARTSRSTEPGHPQVRARRNGLCRPENTQVKSRAEESSTNASDVLHGDTWPTYETGPCAQCRGACHRYGDGGNPLCDDCRTGDRP